MAGFGGGDVFGAGGFGNGDGGWGDGFGVGGGDGNDGGAFNGAFSGFGGGGFDEPSFGAPLDSGRKQKKDKKHRSKADGPHDLTQGFGETNFGNDDFGSAAFGLPSDDHNNRDNLGAHDRSHVLEPPPFDSQSHHQSSQSHQHHNQRDDRHGDRYRDDGELHGRHHHRNPGEDRYSDHNHDGHLKGDHYNHGGQHHHHSSHHRHHRDDDFGRHGGYGGEHVHIQDRYSGVGKYDPWKDIPERQDLDPAYGQRLKETLGADYLVHHGVRAKSSRDGDPPYSNGAGGGLPSAGISAFQTGIDPRPPPPNSFLKSITPNFGNSGWRDADSPGSHVGSSLYIEPFTDPAWWPLQQEAYLPCTATTNRRLLDSYASDTTVWPSPVGLTCLGQRATRNVSPPRVFQASSPRRSGTYVQPRTSHPMSVQGYLRNQSDTHYDTYYGRGEISSSSRCLEPFRSSATLYSHDLYHARARSSSPIASSRYIGDRLSRPVSPHDWSRDRLPSSQRHYHYSLNRVPPLYASSEIIASLPPRY